MEIVLLSSAHPCFARLLLHPEAFCKPAQLRQMASRRGCRQARWPWSRHADAAYGRSRRNVSDTQDSSSKSLKPSQARRGCKVAGWLHLPKLPDPTPFLPIPPRKAGAPSVHLRRICECSKAVPPGVDPLQTLWKASRSFFFPKASAKGSSEKNVNLPSPHYNHHTPITTLPSPHYHHHTTITTLQSPHYHHHSTITSLPLPSPQYHHITSAIKFSLIS